MVEILFARGLVKVLFATETFAMVKSYVAVRRKEIGVTYTSHGQWTNSSVHFYSERV